MEKLICIEYQLRAGCTIFLMVRKCFLRMGEKLSIPNSKKLGKVIKIKNKSRGACHVLRSTRHKKVKYKNRGLKE